MAAYAIPSNHLPTHTKKQRRKRETVPALAEQVIYLERTPELYAKSRRMVQALFGDVLDPTCPYFAETAPAEWLALPPLKVSIKA